jgi:hypothetical protein
MNAGEIYLGISGNEILLYDGSRTVTPERIEIVKSNRTLSGRLVEDVIRVYTNHTIEYEFIPAEAFEDLQDLYNLGQHLNLIIVDRNGSPISYTVKMHPVNGKRSLWGSTWFYDGVSVLLEEI